MQDIKEGTHSPQSEEGLTADTLKSIQGGESAQVEEGLEFSPLVAAREALELSWDVDHVGNAAMMGL